MDRIDTMATAIGGITATTLAANTLDAATPVNIIVQILIGIVTLFQFFRKRKEK